MSGEPPRRRRSNYAEMPVSYAAVGASKEADLLRFPPAGATPFEESVRLGSGQERFLHSTSLLMTWGAQRRAGYEIYDLVAGDGGRYSGVAFDVQGRPKPSAEPEDHFGPDGEPFLTAGTTLTVARRGNKDARSQLVVFTVSESRRVGFAWGTTSPDGVTGEQLFTVEHRSDDSVWAVVRGFLSPPNTGVLGIKGRSLVKSAIAAAREQIESLAPGAVADATAAAAAPHDGTEQPGGSAEASPTVRVLRPGESAVAESQEDNERASEPGVETAVLDLSDIATPAGTAAEAAPVTGEDGVSEDSDEDKASGGAEK